MTTARPPRPPLRRLLHVVGGSDFGGAAIIIRSLARATIDHGWEVDVLTTNPRFGTELRSDGIGVLSLDVIRRPIRPWFDLRGMMALTRELQRNRYDLVHTHTSKGGFVGRLAARRAAIPSIVHTMHGFAFHESSGWHTSWPYAVLERRAARWCDQIVTVSKFHREWAIRLGIADPERIEAIPNGIASNRGTAARSSAELRSSLGVGGETTLFLATGRLAPQKGIDLLIRAAAEFRRASSRSFVILVAGDGGDRARLEELARKLGLASDVLFLGFRSDIPDLLAASDVVVLPSLREGMSISLLEAMSAARPLIVSAIGSNREATNEGECAVLVAPNSVADLVHAMHRVVDSASERAAMGARARARYQACYTETLMTDRYMRLYERLVHNNRIA